MTSPLTTHADQITGWVLVIGISLLCLGWTVVNLASSAIAERREQRRQQEADDLARTQSFLAELRDRDINALARGIGMTEMALAEHTAEGHARLSSVAPVIPIQREAAE